ncbi:MAG: DUF1684 domain-containing protein [Pseudomonadota bacterium]|nr:DUF1684 domain-containing protein [Pseudomonadota bacterium]
MPKLHIMLALAAVVVAIAACHREDDADQPDAAQVAAAAVFAKAEQAWRDRRRERLLAPDGWTSLIGLHWIEPGAHYLGSDVDNGIRLAKGPAHIGMIELRKGGVVRFVPDESAALTLDGQPFLDEATLRTDGAQTGPSVIGFDGGKGTATVIERAGRMALRVKHADAPARVDFAGLDYWPADADWKIEGRFIAHPPGKTLGIANIIGSVDEVANPGVIEFSRDGRTFRIEALDEGGDELFLVFADRTNGHGSYPAGRFLYTPMPDARGRVTLDFNQAYSPPCAFTDFATCPLPPQENRLDLAIEAGEKAYRKPHG